jgi:predicted PurR-regulated permease PerM
MSSSPVVPVLTPDDTASRAVIAVPRPKPSGEEIAAYVLITLFLGFILFKHLVPALVAGLALFLILDRVSHSFAKRMPHTTARPLALLLVTLVAALVIIGGIALAVTFMRRHADRVPAMMTKMAEILQSTRAWLGGYGQDIIPEVMTDAETLKLGVVGWLKEHAATLKVAGGTFSMGLVHMLMGMLLAVLVFFRHVTKHDAKSRGTLAAHLVTKTGRFTDAFSRIATAQIKISAVNTALTALYLLVVLPLSGRHVPFATTIIFVTFVCGLIPVLGNLISNTVIVVLSLGISVGTAIASLVFLVLIHKLEYLINSRIVGGETDSQAWEILLAILVGETAFGVSGVVMGPIVYAFVKRELRDRGLV